jgi:3-oxoacyl-[acyl-carrier-protein] synthase II
MTDDIVITGMGAITPIGASIESIWASVLAGRSGIRRETEMDLSELPCGWVGGIIQNDVRKEVTARWGRPEYNWGDTLLEGAVDQALSEAGFTEPLRRPAGLAFVKCCPNSGSSPAEYEAHQKEQADLYRATGNDLFATAEYLRRHPGTRANHEPINFPTRVSQRLGVPVMATRLEATCAGGVRAFAEAARILRAKKADVAVAAAVASRRSHYVLSQYAQLMALSRWKESPEQASMPFDRRRSGMVISEGAAAIVLETAEHAQRRGAETVHATVGGWGLALDTAHITAPNVDMVERVIRSALENSEFGTNDIDAINAHGTSTRLNDVTEARALHKVFGERMKDLDVSAVKSLTGHCSAASGILEIIVSALTMEHGIVPPVVTCTEPDPECNVRTHLTPVERPVKAILKNSFGFGGQFASVVIKHVQ